MELLKIAFCFGEYCNGYKLLGKLKQFLSPFKLTEKYFNLIYFYFFLDKKVTKNQDYETKL